MSTETMEAPETIDQPTTTTDGEKPLNPLHSLFETINVPEKTETVTPPATEKKVDLVKVETAKPEAKVEPVKDAPKDPKAVEAPVVDEVEKFAKELSPKANKRFLEMSEQRAEKLAAERAEKIVAERLKGANPEEFTKLKTDYEAAQKRLQETERTLREVDITRTREYRERFVEPVKKIDAQVDNLAKEFEVDGDRLKTLLQAPLTRANAQALDDLTDGLPSVAKQLVTQIGLQLREIKEQERAVMGDPEAAAAAIEASRKQHFESMTKQIGAQREQVFDSLLPDLKKSTPLLFEGERAAANEELVGKVRESLNMPLDQLPPHVRGNLLYNAVIGKQAIATLSEVQQQVSDLTEKLAAANELVDKYRKSDPALESGGGSDSQSKEAPKTLWQTLQNP